MTKAAPIPLPPGRRGTRWCLLLAGLALAWPVPAQGSESALKLAFACNFARFTHWPASALSASTPVTLCLAKGDAGFEAALAGLQGKAVHGRPLRTLVIGRPAEAEPCHVLMLPATSERPAAEYVRQLGKADILTVSDASDFLDEGGMIQLVEVNDHLQFDINVKASQAAGLHISSQLLRLARSLR